MNKKRIIYWLNHPTQVDVPFFKALSLNPSVDLMVVYCNWESNSGNPFDKEINKNSGWDFDYRSGYNFKSIKSGLLSGFYNFFKEIQKEPNVYSVIQGTNSTTFIGVILASIVFRKRILIRYDSTLHYSEVGSKSKYFKRLFFPLFLRSGVETAYTGTWAKEYLKFYGMIESRMFWFPYIVDNDWLNKKANDVANCELLISTYNLENKFVFLVVAKFNHRESPLDVIKAFEKLKLKDATLIIVGDGPDGESLSKYVESCEYLKRSIIFTGYVTYERLGHLYGVSNVFIHPAREECWGVSVNEAMACGLPVVASNQVGSGVDLISPGQNGFVYPYGDIFILSNIMKELYVNKNLEDLRLYSLNRIVEYSPENTASRLLKYILKESA